MRIFKNSSSAFRLSRGFSLVELAIVLGIASIVLGGVWSVGSSVQKNREINQTIENVGVLTQNIRSFYKGQTQFHNDPTAAINEVLIKAGLVPQDMENSPTQLRSPWGTDINVYTYENQFAIEFKAPLKNDVCRQIASRMGGTGHAEGILSIIAGGRSYSGYGLDQISPSTLPTNCNQIFLIFSLSGHSDQYAEPSTR